MDARVTRIFSERQPRREEASGHRHIRFLRSDACNRGAKHSRKLRCVPGRYLVWDAAQYAHQYIVCKPGFLLSSARGVGIFAKFLECDSCTLQRNDLSKKRHHTLGKHDRREYLPRPRRTPPPREKSTMR